MVARDRLADAAAAGVAIQTVYKVFGSKQALLPALVDVTAAGDDEPVALPDRQFRRGDPGADQRPGRSLTATPGASSTSTPGKPR
jgi:AcrR family transcriptional regulator